MALFNKKPKTTEPTPETKTENMNLTPGIPVKEKELAKPEEEPITIQDENGKTILVLRTTTEKLLFGIHDSMQKLLEIAKE